jgi:hypothetical protein
MKPAQNDFEHALLTSMSIKDNELSQQSNSNQAERLSLLSAAYESTHEKQGKLPMKRKRRNRQYKNTPPKKKSRKT